MAKPMTHTAIRIAADADFYTLVHQLVESEKSLARKGQSVTERRAANRQPFDCTQLLAPFRGDRLPSQAEFRPVVCQDLSAGGFAFLSPDRIDFDELIVALGQVPFRFFAARVQNESCVRARGRQAYRVGCRFTGRIVAH
jgi:hypothetical protein